MSRVRRDPVDAGNHGGRRTAAIAVEHADGDERDLPCDAVGRACYRAGDVRAVPMTVGAVAAERVEAEVGPSAELHVVVADAGVDDIGRHPGAVAARVENPSSGSVR